MNSSEIVGGASIGCATLLTADRFGKVTVPKEPVDEPGPVSLCMAVTGDGVNDSDTSVIVGSGAVPNVKLVAVVVVDVVAIVFHPDLASHSSGTICE